LNNIGQFALFINRILFDILNLLLEISHSELIS